MNTALSIVFLGLLVFLAHFFAAIYTRRNIPDVLLLMIIGLLLGPVLHWVSPDSFGVGGSVFVAVTLVVILFESGTSLTLDVLQSSWKQTVTLSFAGFFVAMVLTAGIGMLFGMDILTSLLLGAILGGTSSAVVIPLVKNLQLGEESRTVLILESAATDVLCIVFALAFLEGLRSGNVNVGGVVGNVLSSFVLAGLLGFAGAVLWSRLITSMRKLQNSIFTTPAFVFIIYGVAEILGYSGAIAALVFGISMANIDTIHNPLLLRIMGGKGHQLNRTEKIFFGEIVFLLKTIFFVYIGMSMEFNDVKSLLAGLAITFVLFAGRIVLTRFVMPKSAPIFDKTITSIMIPKGLAAAVLAGIPLAAGVSGGEFIRNTTYAVILFSILWVSIMILLVDKWPAMRRFYFLLYGVRDEAEQGKSLFISTKDTGEEDEDGIGVLSRSASALLDYYKRKTGETPHKAVDGTQAEAADETPQHTVSEELRKTESDECK
ncbi:MAG: cation:proton antiporter [Bacteroidales bacterium]|nr:cation:proton antiporter [Bacteroidales bacterium]